MEGNLCRCKLCGMEFSEAEMSEEHYPARSTGNDDVVALDFVKMMDSFLSTEIQAEIRSRLANGEKIEEITGDIFDTRLSIPIISPWKNGKNALPKMQHLFR